MGQEEEDTSTYVVVANDKKQYSIWRDDAEFARGSRTAGESGSRTECPAWVKEVRMETTSLSPRWSQDGGEER